MEGNFGEILRNINLKKYLGNTSGDSTKFLMAVLEKCRENFEISGKLSKILSCLIFN